MPLDIIRHVVIEEACDSFDIVMLDINGDEYNRFHFDQEDTKRDLVKLFEFLGYDASYEEIY